MSDEKDQPGTNLVRVEGAGGSTSTLVPSKQLSELPNNELEQLAEGLGLDPGDYKTRQSLVAAVHDRRQMIAAFDREAMLDVLRWAGRPLSVSASKEQLAHEIVRIKSMRFSGLSQRGLAVLAKMRGLNVRDNDPVPELVRQLKKQEGIFAKLNRKRRAMVGGWISNLIGESKPADDYRSTSSGETKSASTSSPKREASIKEEIEESGLFGGITSRIKRTADQYLNQKLDEIESRIDRKLDEIDRRLAEWRDKEIANRIRILKITLWASVIVALVSLIYAYIKVTFR